ncbi:MAG: sigma-70 family RNA polymerase sigma factor [Caldisericia bacterium]|nr:sigma-70 family RNA polymerase sigma factor [Caldisericia bacterium]
MDDKELVGRVKKGEVSAFAILVEKYEREIFEYSYFLIGDREEALDMTQETFLKAYTNIKTLRREEDFKFWLRRIARNLCFKRIKKMRREKELMERQREETLSLDSYVIKKEREERVKRALNKLPEKMREIIILRDIEGLSYKEIKEILNIPMSLVKVRIFRARNLLKRILEEEDGGV